MGQHHLSRRFERYPFQKDSLNLIPSPSPTVKIQIMGGKVCSRDKGKTLLGVVNKLLKKRNFVDNTKQFVAFCSFFPCSLTVFIQGRQQKSGGRQQKSSRADKQHCFP